MSSSIEQFFNETQAVATILSDWVKESGDIFECLESGTVGVRMESEEFTAIWQAVELLSRATTYIHAQMMAEGAKAALFLPEPVEKKGPGLIVPGGGLVP